jgi:hypothetical protein
MNFVGINTLIAEGIIGRTDEIISPGIKILYRVCQARDTSDFVVPDPPDPPISEQEANIRANNRIKNVFFICCRPIPFQRKPNT